MARRVTHVRQSWTISQLFNVRNFGAAEPEILARANCTRARDRKQRDLFLLHPRDEKREREREMINSPFRLSSLVASLAAASDISGET